MKTDACYAVDGKTHYSVMKETPVPKELKGLVTKNFIMQFHKHLIQSMTPK